LSKENSGSNGPIFISFLPYGKYLIVDCRFAPFTMTEGTLPW